MEKEMLTVLILAAGKGTRMKSDLPKVLHKIRGRPMVEYVIDRAEELGADGIIVVVGHQAEKVIEVISGRAEHVLQQPQLGTGHAVMCAAEKLAGKSGNLLLLFGDVPLISEPTLRKLIETHDAEDNSATILTAIVENPFGYGRIVRTPEGKVDRIVEHKDASEEEREIKEINTGLFCFKMDALLDILKEISNENAQGEYYITDAIELMRGKRMNVGAVIAADARETEGINTEEQLAAAEAHFIEIYGFN